MERYRKYYVIYNLPISLTFSNVLIQSIDNIYIHVAGINPGHISLGPAVPFQCWFQLPIVF